MILKQIYLGCLAQASYLITDEATGQAAIVDPRRDVEAYLEEAKTLGVEIKHVFLTHFHADFISGHLELREHTGAEIHMGSAAEPEFPFAPMSDGDVVEMGKVKLQVLETPGHTPESICVLVFDTEQDTKNPHAVLTGDTLFIGDVGRPDLMASVGISAEELAGQLYDSTRSKLLTLPDETLVYPGHGAGSMCGKNLSTETVSTIGQQRQMNYALQPMDKEHFIGMITANQPKAPAYFPYDAALNKKERATLEESLEKALVPLTAEKVLALRDEGAVVLDTRDPVAYAETFLSGSINIGLGGSYAIWAGTVLSREKPLVLIAGPGAEKEAALRLGRIGFDHVVGYLEGGIEAFDAYPDLISHTERVTARELQDSLESSVPVLVLDVRNPAEFEQKHIKGSLLIPLDDLEARVNEVPADRSIVVQCGSGYRSSIGASILRQHGIERVTDLIGGIQAWEASGLDVESQVVGA
jgi:glyoxylase-like metal-dependent hydrolase (beta-lactamase superfamily II)/rhodanese-related sulfurtransferase